MNEKILIYPDPFLRMKATMVESINKKIADEIEAMNKILETVGGLGLASIQVGIKSAIILYRENGEPDNIIKSLINPTILKILDETYQKTVEGCLSIPEVFIPIKRHKKIEVAGVNQYGNKVILEADGMLSTVLQHEIDHLNGTLMVDRLSRLQKNIFKRRLKGMKFVDKSV